MHIIKRLILRPLKKQIFLIAKNVKYKITKSIQKQYKSIYHLKRYLLYKTKIKKNFYGFFKKLVYKKNICMFKQKINYVNLNKKFCIDFSCPGLIIKNRKKKLNYRTHKKTKYFNLNAFYSSHLFLKFFEHKLAYFLFRYIKLKHTQITFQEEFSMPRASLLLHLVEKRVKERTFFLKQNKKFYNNFINLMPIIQTFKAIQLLATQIAFELSRTKKH